jgi:flagellar biosynthesis protein FlhF
MRILKFEGATMREALAAVKAELGDQAVVVSTRQVKKGLLGSAYEIAAAVEDDKPAARPQSPAFTAALANRNAAPQHATNEDDVERAVAPLRAELRSLRAMLRAAQAPAAAPRKPVNVHPAHGASHLPAHAHPAHAHAAASLPPTPLAAPSTAATVMLIGATGVGKTTTIAKIAARAALIERRRVALVTLDNYRVGGVDQIRTFADLIGVPLYVCDEPNHLAAQLDELAGYDLTLIDTAGRSPRDRMAIATLERALINAPSVEVHLTAPASTSAAQLDELRDRFSPLRPRRLLITKLDECGRAPDLVAAPTRLQMPITWLATGQQVPEDLEVATAPRLAELAKFGLHPATDDRAA